MRSDEAAARAVFEERHARSNGGGPARIVTAAELLGVDFPEVSWAVPGIVPEGVSLLAGKPKLGKSWMALGWCVAVAAGGFALGTVEVEEGSALYLALEDNRRRLQKRLKKVLAGDAAPDGLHLATEWPRLDNGGLELLAAHLEANPDTRLVVIDTLAKIRPEARGQNVYAEDYAALEKLLPLAAEHGVAVVVVHHLRKMGAVDPLDEISGSTGLSGGVDGVLVLKRDRGRADAYLHVTGRDIEEDAELALTWDQELAAWKLAGDAEEYRQSEERRRIVGLLAGAGEPMSPKDIAEALDKNRSTTRVLLANMKQDGQVEAVEGGYTLHRESKQPKHPKQDKQPKQPKQPRGGDAVGGVGAVYGVYAVGGVNGLDGTSRRLTEEEARKVQRLIHEGTGPEIARREVLGEGA